MFLPKRISFLIHVSAILVCSVMAGDARGEGSSAPAAAGKKTSSRTAATKTSSGPWLLKLDRPKVGDHIISGTAPDTSRHVRIELRDGDGKLLEARTASIEPVEGSNDHSFIVGFQKAMLPDSAILAYTIVSNNPPVQDRMVLVQAGASTVANQSQPPPTTPARQRRIAGSHSSTAAGTGGGPRGRGAAPNALRAELAPANLAVAAQDEPAPEDTSGDADPPAPAANPCDASDAPAGLVIDAGTVHSGNAHLTGKSYTIPTGTLSFCVNGKPVQVASTSDPKNFQDSVQFANGAVDVTLKDALKTNEGLLAIATSAPDDNNKTTKASQEFPTVSAAIPKSKEPTIATDLVPGLTEIKVQANPTLPNMGYEARIMPCPGFVGPDANLPVKWATPNQFWEVTGPAGVAVFKLDQPLYGGQQVKFCEDIVDTTDPRAPVLSSSAQRVPQNVNDPLDLGRVRYSFTSGVVVSQKDGFQTSTGSNAGLFLGFDADRAWLPIDAHGMSRYNLNTYFDARLTSVATQGAVLPAGQTPTLDTFKSSSKAASLQAGIYVPFVTTRWAKDRYSLFVAPLAKAGFVTLTDDQTFSSAPPQTVPVTNRFYTSFSYGTRLGVYRHFRSRDAAPDLISFVDITAGKFGDFEAFRQIQTAERNDLLGYNLTNEMIRLRPWRWSFEGLLKMPHTPFVVGFNANIGLTRIGAQNAFDPVSKTMFLVPFAQPKDDLRFLFGARFDAGKLFRSLPLSQ